MQFCKQIVVLKRPSFTALCFRVLFPNPVNIASSLVLRGLKNKHGPWTIALVKSIVIVQRSRHIGDRCVRFPKCGAGRRAVVQQEFSQHAYWLFRSKICKITPPKLNSHIGVPMHALLDDSSSAILAQPVCLNWASLGTCVTFEKRKS